MGTDGFLVAVRLIEHDALRAYQQIACIRMYFHICLRTFFHRQGARKLAETQQIREARSRTRRVCRWVQVRRRGHWYKRVEYCQG